MHRQVKVWQDPAYKVGHLTTKLRAWAMLKMDVRVKVALRQDVSKSCPEPSTSDVAFTVRECAVPPES